MSHKAAFDTVTPQNNVDALHQMVYNMEKFAFIHYSIREDFFNTIRPILKKKGVYAAPQPKRGAVHTVALWVAINNINALNSDPYTTKEQYAQMIEDAIDGAMEKEAEDILN